MHRQEPIGLLRNQGSLSPEYTLSLCKGNDYLLRRRCAALLGKLGLGEAQRDRWNKGYVFLPPGPAERVYVDPTSSGGLSLEFYPADTVGQARDFFAQVDRARLLALLDEGWTIEPHLHFSFRGTHLVWPTSTMLAADYLDYWLTHPSAYGRVQKDELPGLMASFIALGLMSTDDVAEMEEHFLRTKRTNANTIPGFKVAYHLPISEASMLDDRGQLGAKLASLGAVALATWKQPMVQ